MISIHRKKSFYEFFAGVGLVHEALSRTRWECVYANDIDRKKYDLYRGRFVLADPYFHIADVWETDAVLERLHGDAFLATASFPCTDLSSAGRQAGFGGPHSSALFGFFRVLAKLGFTAPPLVLLENVPGFLTANKGRDFREAVTAFAHLGYWVDVFILDAAYFVPQSRPRVFVVGWHSLAGNPGFCAKAAHAEALPYSSPILRPPRLLHLMSTITLPTGWTRLDLPVPEQACVHLEDCVGMESTHAWWDDAAVLKHYNMLNPRHKAIIDSHLGAGEPFLGTAFRRKRGERTYLEVRFDGIAGCLRTPRGGSAKQIIVATVAGRLRMRWMTSREYARLQGAPDFPLGSNESENLFGMADGVCVPVIEWIDQHILSPLYEWAK